jgi:hypothetical protein
MTIDTRKALDESGRIREREILPALRQYIRIPNKSPAHEPNQQANMDRAGAHRGLVRKR